MLFGGIDWSDRVLDFHLRTADGKVLAQGQVQTNVEGLTELFTALEKYGRPEEIGIAIETSHGAWVQALLDHGYKVYPVNPKTVERFREALSAAGHKSDKIDRKVLAMFLATFHQDNKPLCPDAPEIISLAPSLLACLGRDPQRFASAADARALMGTAPVTKASGNYRSVHFRRGCWKFARRTLQLFADKSRHRCAWAQTFYEKQRNSGHNHHAALRALAHKWLKIILAMRRTGTRYNEQTFINSQRRYLLKIPMLTTKNTNSRYNEQTFINSQRRYLLKIPMLTTKNTNFLIGA